MAATAQNMTTDEYVNNCEFDYGGTYYKVVGANHGGAKYAIGINRDPLPFNPNGSCEQGGIYFITAERVCEYYNQSYGENIAELRIPLGTPVYKDPDGNKWKTPIIDILRIIQPHDFAGDIDLTTKFGLLFSREKIAFLFSDQKDEQRNIDKLIENSSLFKFLANKTASICKLAVHLNGDNVKYVPEEFLTETMCIQAAKRGSLGRIPINRITQEVCDAAVTNSRNQFDEYPEQFRTEDMCVKIVPYVGIHQMPESHRTEAVCLASVQICRNNIKYVPQHIRELPSFAAYKESSCIIL